MKKGVVVILIVIALGAVLFFFRQANAGRDEIAYSEIAVTRETLTEKALAVGKIDPDHEIVIKSQVSGIVAEIHREVGEEIHRGEPLLVIQPEPTPMELADAQRQLELAELERTYAENDLKRAKTLYANNFISGKEYEDTEKALLQSDLRVKQAQERLELLESGSSMIGDQMVESVIRAQTDGTILERLVNVGDPVVPLTSYQPGTELMRVARMDSLIFIGTVDEIDVGKVHPGMKALINIGALPGETLEGELYFISPKSRLKDNMVVFDIKIRITDSNGLTLRAGYSANADLIVTEREDVLTIPERLVVFNDDTTWVNRHDALGDSLYLHPVELGFSDGLAVEVLDGLAEGDIVIEQ